MDERVYRYLRSMVEKSTSAEKLRSGLLYALEAVYDLSRDSHLAKEKARETVNLIQSELYEEDN